jgi:hypothetical protein
MNILTFLNKSKPQGDLTIIDTEMMMFDLYSRNTRQELSVHFGPELAKQISEAAKPEYERIRSIIARVQPGIDYSRSREAIEEFEKELESVRGNSFWALGELNKFVRKGIQDFAYDNDHAYDITEQIIYDANNDIAMYKCPFVLYQGDTKYINFAWPEEGTAGGLASVIYLSRRDKENHPHVGFSKYRYIYTRELVMTPEQIAENITDEIDRGETPLTGGGLPGWV